MHYEGLAAFLLAQGAEEQEALRRLHVIHFDIGSAQRGVFDWKGNIIIKMTAELEEWCKARIRGKLQEYFLKVSSGKLEKRRAISVK